MSDRPLCGQPDGLRSVADSLGRIADQVAEGVEIDPEDLRLQLRVAAAHAVGAASQLEIKESAQQKADARATRSVHRLMSVDLDAGFNPHGFFVYVLWGADDVTPLYVGQSKNVLGRLGSHLESASKREKIERVTLVRCPTAAAMAKTELRMIRHYRPPWNRYGLETRPSRLRPA